MCNKNGEWSINKYVNYDNAGCSICREERQYALYLSNVLRYYGNEKHRNKLEDSHKAKAKAIINSVFNKLEGEEKEQTLDNIYIENVFYEATFMRDIFDANRKKYLNEFGKIKNSEDWSWKQEYLKEIIDVNNNCSISFDYNLLLFCWNKYFKNKDNIDEKDSFSEHGK